MKISYEKFNTNLKNCFGCMLYSGSHAKYLPNMLHRCLYDGCESIVESAGQGSEWTTYPCAIRTCPIQVSVQDDIQDNKTCGNCRFISITPNGSETYRCFISPCVIHHVKQPGCKYWEAK